MAKRKDPDSKYYYFIDIDPYSRQIVSWDTEAQSRVTIRLDNGLYRVFLSKGQYNKLVRELEDAQDAG